MPASAGAAIPATMARRTSRFVGQSRGVVAAKSAGRKTTGASDAPARPGRALDAAQYGLGPLLLAVFLGFPPVLPGNPRDLPGAVLAAALLGGGWIVFLRTRPVGRNVWLGRAIGATLLIELAGSCLLPWRAARSPFFSPWLAAGLGLVGAALAVWGFTCLRQSRAGPGREEIR